MQFAPGVWKYAVPPFLVVPLLAFVSPPAALLALALGLFVLLFFRDPERTPPESGVLAPADGSVSVLREEGDRVRLGIFMNVWHVHVVRTPVSATVCDVEHVPGANKPAFSKDSDRNERVHLRLETDEPIAGRDEPSATNAELTLIAGAFARRIHPYAEADDDLERGDRVGHIAFGSRVDVLFPPTVEVDDLAVEPGDSTRAGKTVILDN